MEGEITSEPTRVELWIRSLCPRGQVGTNEQLVTQLERLHEAEVIGSFEVHVSGNRLPLSTAVSRTSVGKQALGRYGQFRRWADEAGCSINEFFEVRDVQIECTDESVTTLVFPSAALAEYEGDTLCNLTPRVDGGTVHTVRDRLAELGESASEEAHAEPRPLEI